MALRHDVGVVWHHCKIAGCTYQSKLKQRVTTHLALKHDVGVTWHACPQPNCDYQSKLKQNVKAHMAYRHGIGVVWHDCPQPNCDYKGKTDSELKCHLANRHCIGVTWRYCDQPDCDFKAKKRFHIKQHLINKHDIGIVWQDCDVPNCDFRGKSSSHLYDHVRRMHAGVYAQRKKEQEEKVRRALLAGGWKEHHLAETMPPVGYFRREKRIDFNCAKRKQPGALAEAKQFCKIDFVLGVPCGYVFLEVDEGQHRFGYDNELMSCDMKRMGSVQESLAIETDFNVPNVYWLRFNPHAHRANGDLVKVPKAERERRLLAWLERFECVAPLGIGYAFYDYDDEEGLEVLGHPDYADAYAEVVENLKALEEDDDEEEEDEDELCMPCD